MPASKATSPVRVDPAPFEPAYGLLARLAVRHGHDAVEDFAALVGGTNASQLTATRKVALAAALNGEDEADLARRSIGVAEDGRATLLGEAVGSGQHLGHAVRYGRVCPRCLAEDDRRGTGPVGCRPYRRGWWDLVAIPCCHVHRTPLVDDCAGCGGRLGRGVRPGVCAGCGARREAADDALPAAELLGQAYLLGRLGVAARRPHAALDGVDFHLAADVMLWIGIAACWPGADRSPAHLGPLDRSRALTAGMRVLAGGPGALRTVLDAMAAAVPVHLRSPQRVYGRLQQRLPAVGGSLGWLLDEVRSHAGANVMAKGRTRLFGERPKGGSWTTAGQIARRCGHSVERLGTVGRLTGIWDPGVVAIRSTPIETAVAGRLEAFIAGTVDVHGACEALGVGRKLFDRLVEAGMVARAFPMEGTSVPASYLKGDLADLEERIAGPCPRGVVPDGVIPISAAVRACYRSSFEIVQVVLDGTLRTHGRPSGVRGVLSTLVDPEEVVLALPRDRDPNLMYEIDACHALGVSPSTLKVLKQSGLVASYKGGTGLRVVKAFDARQVRAVLERLVGARHLAESVSPKTHPKVVHRLLGEAGLRPSVEAPEPLWERAVAERVVKAWDERRREAARPASPTPRVRDPHLVNAHEASRTLGVTPVTISFLKSKGVLTAYEGDDGLRPVTGYDATQVRGLLRTHVGAMHLATSVTPKTNPPVIHRLLKEARVTPLLDAPEPLWERAAAEGAVKAWVDGGRKPVRALPREDAPDLMTWAEACEALGVRRSTFCALKAKGMLPRYVAGHRTLRAYDGRRVRELLETHVGAARLAVSMAPPVPSALVRRLLRAAGVPSLVDGGDPLWLRSAAEEVVGTWEAGGRPTVPAPPREMDSDLMTLPEVSYVLGVSRDAVRTLRASGVLASRKGDNGARVVEGYDATRVEALTETHVSASHLAASVTPRTTASVVKRLLAAAGLRPEVDGREPLWLRAAADEAIMAWDARRHGVGTAPS